MHLISRFGPLLAVLFLLPVFLTAQDDGATSDRLLSVYFPSDGSALSQEGKVALATYANELRSFAGYELELSAYTDEEGDDDYNDRLARRRANTVRNYLLSLEVLTTEPIVSTFGESQARRNTSDDTERQADRRVDLVADVVAYSDLTEVITAVKPGQRQLHQLAGNEVSTLVGEQGTVVAIDPGSFETLEGKAPTGTVTVSITEALTLPAMLTLGLTTTAGERMLETGGMIRVEATDEAGQELRLVKDRTLEVSVPTGSFAERMQLFTGKNHNENEVPTDWSESPDLLFGNAEGMLKNVPFRFRPAPKNVFIEALLQTLMKAYDREHSKPNKNAFVSIPKPRNPIEPRPFDADKIKLPKQGLFGRLFGSKKKRAAELIVLREQAKERHTARVEGYKKRVVKYEVSFQEYRNQPNQDSLYEVAMKAYHLRRDAFRQKSIDGISLKHAEHIAKLQADYREWQEERRTALNAHRQERLNSAVAKGDNDAVSRYFFQLSRLGWTNIDRYVDQAMAPVFASLPSAPVNTTVFIMPASINSVVAMKPVSGRPGLWSADLPAGSGYRVVAYYLEKGQLQLAHREFEQERPEADDLTVMSEPVAVADLTERLASLFGR